jgi:hypothetical protein
MSGRKRFTFIILVVVLLGVGSALAATITKTFDRKFPLIFCPLDLSGWQDPGGPTDLSFIAPSSSVRITFSTPNYYNGVHVNTHIDDFAVVLKSEFPDNSANVHPPSPTGSYYTCSFPPDGDESDATHAPSFVFTHFAWPGPAGPILNRFDASAECWMGDAYFDGSRSAPRDPANEADTTLGSLGIGTALQQGTVSASRIVTGLTPGAEYVVSAWWHAEKEDAPLTLTIDGAACVDQDGDGFVDCSGCAPCELQGGQTCGECDDADPAVHPAAGDASCDGLDQDCSGQADEDFPGGCGCVERAAGLVGWWPADGNANDLVGPNDGMITGGTGVVFVPGLVGDVFYFAYAQAGGVELPDGPELEFTSQMTLEAWIDPEELTESTRPIISKLSPSDYAYSLEADLGGVLVATVSDDGSTLDFLISPPGVIQQGAWSHVATTFDAGLWKLYVNGALVASKMSSVTSIYDQGSTHANIGRAASGSPEFVGYIDEVAMYDRALTGGEIRAIYTANAQGMCQCADADGDGYGSGGLSCPGGVQPDCDDSVASRHPNAAELCNGVDDDCNGTLDNGLSQATFFRDVDGDGFGNATGPTLQACAAPPGYAAAGGDCRDSDPAVHPGAPDVFCDGIDDDCDGQVDEGAASACLCAERGTGLAAWFQAEGNALNQTGGFGGTLMGTATFAAGEVGQAFSLDGAGWVEVPDATTFEFTTQLTQEAWIRPDDVSNYRGIISKFGTNGNWSYQMMVAPGGALRTEYSGNGTTYEQVSSPTGLLGVGVWAHVAMTFKNGLVLLYVNGTQVASYQSAITAIYSSGTTKPTIGRDPVGLQYFAGRIDEAALYNRALGAGEIGAIYAAGAAGMCPCRDNDRDGYGASAGVLCYAGTQQDCNESVATTHPGAPELCNGVDDDCDATIDDGLAQTTFYRDADGDTYGDPMATLQACATPPGYRANNIDCNDGTSGIHPGAADSYCDGVDEDCDGTADGAFQSPANIWWPTPGSLSPDPGYGMSMVSAGTRVIEWGGYDSFLGALTNFGRTYTPSVPLSDFWQTTSVGANVPAARAFHTAVWIGNEMIVWGGAGGGGDLADGGRYNPFTDAWTSTSTTGAPGARQGHTAVSTGSKMIIWGGVHLGIALNTGAIYDPVTNTWTTMSTSGAPAGRFEHAAVWTGTEMIVWGGFNGSSRYADGARYNPTTNTWAALPAVSPGEARSQHTAVWTGSAMLVWGGWNGTFLSGNGLAYDRTLNSWSVIAPGGGTRRLHTAVWDPADGLMLLFGGFTDFGAITGGVGYNPVTHAWTSLTTVGALPAARYSHLAAWIDPSREMMIWGGTASGSYLSSGGRVVPAPFTCGSGPCAQPSRFTCTAGTIGYGCAAAIPTANVVSTGSSTQVSWAIISGATGYDVVKGNVASLRSSGGDFTASTTACLGNDVTATSVPDGEAPPPSRAAAWYLVRKVTACAGNGSYDEGAASQLGSRDAEIAASGGACP